METPSNGWYPDPQNPDNERYWEGVSWTDHVRPRNGGPSTPPPMAPPAGSPVNTSLPPRATPPPPPSAIPGAETDGALLDPSFGDAIKEAMRNYGKAKGRASRKAYWLFWVFTFIANLGESLVLGTGLAYIVFLLPGITCGIRRMHDSDRSGWWLLIPIVNLVFLVQAGDEGANKYGPRPA